MELEEVATAFVATAHEVVWATVATVDGSGRPRSRVLHPIWELDRQRGGLLGWIGTDPTSPKVRHLARTPYASVTYWSPAQATGTAECAVRVLDGLDDRVRAWDRFLHGPEPVGYDPAIVPRWADGPASPRFAVLELRPWSLSVLTADGPRRWRGGDVTGT